MDYKVKTATGLIALYMHAFGYKGWASFWRTLYLVPGYEKADWLIRHETCHLDQIERMGRFKFTIKYMYWMMRYGYDNHPLEIEARASEWPKGNNVKD